MHRLGRVSAHLFATATLVTIVAAVVAYASDQRTEAKAPDEVFTELAPLTARDGMAEAHFGASLAVDHHTAVITSTQAVYIFQRRRPNDDDRAGGWRQTAKLRLPRHDGVLQSDAVAISGDTVLVRLVSGRIAVFDRHQGGAQGWAHVATLEPDLDDDRRSVTAVAISNDTAAVATIAHDFSDFPPGKVHIFQRNAGGRNVWGEVAQVQAPTENRYLRFAFGVGIALERDTLVVVADATTGLGSETYVFERHPGKTRSEPDKWLPKATLGGFNHFNSVSMSGDTIATTAGEYLASVGIHERRKGRRWAPIKQWRLGSEVCCAATATVGGVILAVSARESGHLLLYTRGKGGPGGWEQVGAFDIGPYPGFHGFPTGVTRDTVLVGAYLDDTPAGHAAGAVRVYAARKRP